jgi:hypothetical protein
MNHKSFGWAAVLGCILSVTIAVIGGRETRPPSAQADWGQGHWSVQDQQACQAVMNQMHAVRQTAWNEKLNGQATQLSAMDDLVSRESQIDTAKCPADFRRAEARFAASQDTLSVDAHMDYQQNGDCAFRAMFDHDSAQYSSHLAANASDAMKRDLQQARDAAQDFEQIAAKYGAK